eukprot:998406-Pelagomonas_calceolata.AAC.1
MEIAVKALVGEVIDVNIVGLGICWLFLSLLLKGFYMGPEVRALVQHSSRFPSGTPCDTDHFLFLKEAVSCLFFSLGQ